MLKIMIFLVGFIMTASLNAGETFNYEVSLGISDGEEDIESKSISVSYFSDGIRPSSGPFSESEFLSRSSSLSFSYNKLEDLMLEDESFSLDIKMFNQSRDFFVDAFFHDLQFNGIDSENYGFGLGSYIGESTTVSFLLSRLKVGVEYELDHFIGNISYLSTEALNYKIDLSLGLVNGIAPIANMSISDEDDVYDLFTELELSYFPNNRTSFVLASTIYTRTLKSILVEEGGDPEPTTADDLSHYSLTYEYFWTKKTSTSIVFGKKKNDFFYNDFDYISINYSQYF